MGPYNQWGGINLQDQVTPQITAIIPEYPMTLHIYTGFTNDEFGLTTTSYTTYNILVQMQLTSRQTLELIDGVDLTKVYRDFRLQSYTLTGLNRNLSTGGDYIQWGNLYYRIVALPENFLPGWVWVVGEESTGIPNS